MAEDRIPLSARRKVDIEADDELLVSPRLDPAEDRVAEIVEAAIEKERLTVDELEATIRGMLAEEPLTARKVIKRLCTGPQEMAVRRAIWRLLYDQEAVGLDDDLRMFLKEANGG